MGDFIVTRLQPGDRSLDDVIQEIVNLKAANVYRRSLQYMREVGATRWREASFKTPYAPGSIGTKQTYTGLTRGQGALFGLDSGQAFREMLRGLKIGPDGLFFYTNLAYFWALMALYAQKGPFAPEHILYFDQTDIIQLESYADDAVFAAAYNNPQPKV